MVFREKYHTSGRETMTCSYCGSHNSEGESRCRRCGRKPGDTLTGEIPPPFIAGSAAPELKPVPRPKPVAAPKVLAAVAGTGHFGKAVQVPLFRDRPASNVIAISEPATVGRPASSRTPTIRERSPKRAMRVPENQASLDFLPSPPAPKKLGTTVDAVIVCDAPV